jgi:CRP-like cAMP-binding protein
MFMIELGYVHLYAENDHPFAVFRIQGAFGDSDIFCNTRRNGTAKAMSNCILYVVNKSELEDLLHDYPTTRR